MDVKPDRDGHEGRYQSQNGLVILIVSVHKAHRTPFFTTKVLMTIGINNSVNSKDHYIANISLST